MVHSGSITGGPDESHPEKYIQFFIREIDKQ